MQSDDTHAHTGGRRSLLARASLGLVTLIGAAISVVVAIDFLQAVSTYFWEETICTIEASSVVERPTSDEFELIVTYRYHLRGESYVGDRVRHGYTGSSSASRAHRMAARYAPGETVSCWVDPDEPRAVYLLRANLWRGLSIFVPLIFVAIGLGGLYALRDGWAFSDRSKPQTSVAAKPMRTGAVVGILFGTFFLFGFGLFIPFFVWPTLQVVEARSWTPVECEIVSSGVRTHSGDDGATYSVEALYRYRIDGREYTSNRYRFMSGSSSGYDGKAEAAARIPAGSTTTCWVDPDDPYEAVIDRGFGLDFLFGLIPLVFGLIGAGGLGFAIWSKRSARRDAGRPSPQPAVLTTYRTGPTRLEPHLGPLARLGCATLVALFWNGIVSVFLWNLIAAWRQGHPDWFLALFLTPFVLIGLLLLSGVPYTALALINPRPIVHLSTGVLKVGESAQIDWSYRGAAGRIEALEISLQCSKTETRTVETPTSVSTSVRTKPIRTIEILDHGAGYPLAFGSVGFRVPDDAEPTREGHDAIAWKLHFHGTIDYWPDAHEEFAVEILPADD